MRSFGLYCSKNTAGRGDYLLLCGDLAYLLFSGPMKPYTRNLDAREELFNYWLNSYWITVEGIFRFLKVRRKKWGWPRC